MPSYDQWLACWRELGAEENQVETGLYETLCARYTEPHRHYHSLQHLDECLEHFTVLRELAEHPAEIELALWFHDAIYEPARHDNEQLSAEWAAASVRTTDLSTLICTRIDDLIMATRHHQATQNKDTEILLDCDLAILGASPERFAEYESQIRAEYAFVPETLFRAKRSGILRDFLKRPALFYTGYFIERYETQARTNLSHAISLLT